MAGPPFAVDGSVNLEKLREVLTVQTEVDEVEFKSAGYDLTSGLLSRVDFVKDCAGLMSLPEGGYLVLGVDGHGRPVSPGVDRGTYDDGGTLRGILDSYLDGPFQLRSQVHDPDGVPVALLYLGPADDGLPIVVKKPGSYMKDGREKHHFRTGEIVLREGSRIRDLRRTDLRRLLASFERQIRADEQTRIDVLRDLIQAGLRGQQVAAGPARAFSWQLPETEFDDALIELIRSGDLVPIKVMLRTSQTDARRLLREPGQYDRLLQVLDRMTAVLAIAVWLESRAVFDQALQALVHVYGSANRDGSPANDLAVRPELLWREITLRIEAVGGLAVRFEMWWAIAPLTLQPVGTSYTYTSWMRHGFTWASRAELFKNEAGNQVSGAFVALARQVTDRIAALRPDSLDQPQAPVLGQPPPPLDDVLDSIAQFDFLWCLVSLTADGNARDSSRFYPSFAGLYSHRVDPIIRRLYTDPEFRKTITSAPAEDVDRAARVIINYAEREAPFGWMFDEAPLPPMAPD